MVAFKHFLFLYILAVDICISFKNIKDCGKRRVIYCKERLSTVMCRSLDRVQEEPHYTCGSPLFPEGHEFHNKLIVRESLDCETPIEKNLLCEIYNRP